MKKLILIALIAIGTQAQAQTNSSPPAQGQTWEGKRQTIIEDLKRHLSCIEAAKSEGQLRNCPPPAPPPR